jgi:KDO2-lipid IV(A) lauroyltransferase
MVFEIGRVWRMGPEDIGRHIRVDGMERMSAAIDQGKGVIAITGHTGNWELLSTLSARLPRPSNIVYRPLDFKPLDRFFVDFRSRFGGKPVAKSESLKRLFACLRQQEIIALVMDQNVGWRKGVFVDFFGDAACTTKGPAFLALVTGAPVIPLFIRRSENGFVIDIKGAIDTVNTGHRDRDIETNTLRYNKAIEDFIRCYPDQWLWLHRRWKSRPKTDV